MKIAMLGVKGIPVPAGAENVAEQIGVRLVERGHQVTIYVRPHFTPRTLKSYRGLRLVSLPSIPTKHLDAITHSFLASLAVLGERPDLLHLHGIGNSVFSLHPRWFGIKTLVQIHGLDWQRAKWGPLARAYLRLTDYSTVCFPSAVTAVSRGLVDYYQTLSRRPVFYLPNGVPEVRHRPANLLRSLGLEPGEYLLFAARLVPEKGAHLLLEAFKNLQTSKKLVVAGDGAYGDPYAARLKTQASSQILFPGFVQGELLEELYSHAYLYLLPSAVEGLSTGLLEALRYGNCVLVSEIAENREVIGEQGLTFQVGNRADLQAKLADLLAQPEKVAEYRERAREQAARHITWETVTDRLEALYQQILA